MSELTNLVTDFQKMIESKAILSEQVSDLTKQRDKTATELDFLCSKRQKILDEIKAEEATSKKRIAEYNDKQGENIGKEIRRLENLSKIQGETERVQSETARDQKQLTNELAAKQQSLMELEIKLRQDKACLDILNESVTKQQEKNSSDLLVIDSKLRKVQDLDNEAKGSMRDAKSIQENNRSTRLDLEKRFKELGEYKNSLDAIRFELDNQINQFNKRSEELQKNWDEYYRLKTIVEKKMKDTDDLKRGLEAERTELAFEMAKLKAKK